MKKTKLPQQYVEVVDQDTGKPLGRLTGRCYRLLQECGKAQGLSPAQMFELVVVQEEARQAVR